MDKKDGKKKESIDEILSDLNGLLNKMPSILDGIKMPEIKPAEFAPPAGEKKPAPEADKTVVLPPFSGLPEGAPGPELPPSQDAADKTVVMENFSAVPEGGLAPEEGKIVPQSLGDFMFGEDAQQKPEQEKEAETPAPAPEPETTPEPAPAAGEPAAEEVPPFPVIEPETAPAPKPAPEPNAFETTRDFGGIPDIDALLQLSDGKPAPEAPAPAAEAEAPAPVAEAQPSTDELAEFEKQLAAAVPQPQEPAPAAPAAAEEAISLEPQQAETLNLEPQAAETPQPEAAAAAQEPAQAGGLELSLSQEPQPEPAAAAQEPAQAGGLELSLSQEPQPEAAAAAQEPPQAGGLELSLSQEPQEPAPAAPSGLELSISPQPEAAAPAEETLSVGRPPEGLVLEPASAAISGAAPSGDETLVVPPPAGAPEEEKTVIFEAGAAPGITSRSQAGDLAGLAGRQPPEGLPAERVRSLAFLYAPEDKALCATILSELDAICLKSPEKPMFVKRASVAECDPSLNGNYIMQSVADSGAQGLVCVGAIPQEKIYEVESVFTAANGFFRHYDSGSFTHSAALDLVLDLILR